MSGRPSIVLRVAEAQVPAGSGRDVEQWLDHWVSALSRTWPAGAEPSQREVERWLRAAVDDVAVDRARGDRR